MLLLLRPHVIVSGWYHVSQWYNDWFLFVAFKTDGDISGKFETKERELHKWAPTEDENALGLLEEDLEQSGGSWDQFAANEKLFGLKTDFDEEIYTTKLNRSAPGFRDREKRAIEVANEIQKVVYSLFFI